MEIVKIFSGFVCVRFGFVSLVADAAAGRLTEAVLNE